MRLILVGLLLPVAASVACLNTSTEVTQKPDVITTRHFDTLAAVASANGQTKRAAALRILTRTMADGGSTAASLFLTTSPTAQTATSEFSTMTWSLAKTTLTGGVTTVADSLFVQAMWHGYNADTIVVIRIGDGASLAPSIQGDLTTLGMANADTTLSAVLIGPDGTTVVADSGAAATAFSVFGNPCSFISVSSTTNDQAATQCQTVSTVWQFAIRFGTKAFYGLESGGASPGIVLVE